jgi:predicted RNase H-like nuclease
LLTKPTVTTNSIGATRTMLKQQKVVLGLDAAWTLTNPTGVALVINRAEGWELADVAGSYNEFLAIAGNPPILRHQGSVPDPAALIAAGSRKAGSGINLVAIDMPLSMNPITGRRVSDNIISSLYGARGAGTHTPSVSRPGKVSDELRMGFDQIGYPLAVSEIGGPSIVEVYPHPALIELANAARRLPYKHSKIGKYWPNEIPDARRQRLFDVWRQIIELLDARIKGVTAALVLPSSDARGYALKAFEDKLDAVVCAWVGACVLDGEAVAHGDAESAIWVPMIQCETRSAERWFDDRRETRCSDVDLD